MSKPFSSLGYAAAAGNVLLCASLVACHTAPRPAGNDLPVTGADSRALPGSVNAADAPESPRTVTNSQEVTTFQDPETGISFRYPTDWRPLSPAGPLPEPAFAATAGAAQGSEAFAAAGTPYAKTNLAGLSFGWTVKPGLSDSQCTALATRALQQSKPGHESINGVSYTRVEGGDAGMCHQRSAVIDAATHNGKCFLFERDMDTICPDIKGPGQDVALSAAQQATLRSGLDAVMASVQLR